MASSTTIQHMVLIKYSPTVPWPALQAHFTAFLSLRTRCLRPAVTGSPYMVKLRAGQNRSYEGLGKDYTHVYELEFASQDDYDFYITQDPVHRAFANDVNAQGIVEDQVVVAMQDGRLMLSPTEVPKWPGTVAGSCHCGGVRFEVRLPPKGEQSNHVLCHCRTCKLLSGAPFSCNQIVPTDHLKVLDGAGLKKYTYAGASGKAVDCWFCGTCTSHIYHEQEAMPGKVVVRTLLLEGAEDWDVGGQIFEEGRLGWLKNVGNGDATCVLRSKVNGN